MRRYDAILLQGLERIDDTSDELARLLRISNRPYVLEQLYREG